MGAGPVESRPGHRKLGRSAVKDSSSLERSSGEEEALKLSDSCGGFRGLASECTCDPPPRSVGARRGCKHKGTVCNLMLQALQGDLYRPPRRGQYSWRLGLISQSAPRQGRGMPMPRLASASGFCYSQGCSGGPLLPLRNFAATRRQLGNTLLALCGNQPGGGDGLRATPGGVRPRVHRATQRRAQSDTK